MKTKSIAITFLAVFLAAGPAAFRAAAEDQPQDAAKKAHLDDAKKTMEKVCTSMLPHLERPWKINKIDVIDSPEVNAYADQKGNVTFFMGILDFFQSEDEAAVVCGHELAHVSAKHIKRSIGTRILATIAGEAIGGTAGNLAGGLLFTKQSRKHEREADRRGIIYMWQAGFDPRAAWRVWEALNDLNGESPAIAKYFSTHPVDTERINNNKAFVYTICTQNPTMKYCDVILDDTELKTIAENYK